VRIAQLPYDALHCATDGLCCMTIDVDVPTSASFDCWSAVAAAAAAAAAAAWVCSY
jgi:hypothetical protein